MTTQTNRIVSFEYQRRLSVELVLLEPVEGPANEVGFVASDGRDNEGSIPAMQERRRN